MDLNSLQFGGDNYQLTRAMSLNHASTILSGLPSADESQPFSVDLMNKIQDSQLVTSRVIDYYDQRVEEKMDELGFSTSHLGSSNSDPFSTNTLNGGRERSARSQGSASEEPEDIQTIVDEILARSEEVQSGVILDLKA